MTDFSALRRAMVDAQVRANDVTDLGIVAAMLDVPRELFVPADRKTFAYIDDDLLVKEGTPGRYLMEPMVFGKLLQAAAIRPADLVLDVGVGTGYSAAVLARLSGQVVALEEAPELAAQATAHMIELGVPNAAVVQGPLAAGWPGEAPYDVILLEGAVEVTPEALLGQLKPDGRLLAVVGRGRTGRATLFSKSAGTVSTRIVFDAAVPVLPGFSAQPAFVF